MRPKVYRHQGKPYDKVVEYFLPVTEMPIDVQKELPPWLRQMVGKDVDEVKTIVVERWKGIQNPALQAMRDRLLEYQPDSIVVVEGEAYLSLRLEPGTETSVGESWYVPAPEDVKWEKRLEDAGVKDKAVVLEFLQNFAGLREDPVCSGLFFSKDKWDTFPLEGYDLDEIKRGRKWKGSLIVWSDRGGNGLLLHPSGRMGWWWFPDRMVVDGPQDFEEFARYFTEFSRKYSYPFGSHGSENALRSR
jgi:hypothetical protein